MLEEIHLRDLGVIDEAVLELSPGFTVVTGETGAGKTMVLTGLTLLFGGKADAGLVRAGAGRAVVEGRVVLPTGSAAADRVREAGAELDDDVLILARTLSAEGRSRAHAGGRGVPAALLAELADDLVAVHGQSDQQRLLRPGVQRATLDRYGGAAVAEPYGRYTEAWARHRAVCAELEELTARRRERAQEADLLRFGLDEVAAADPQPGEEEALAAEIGRLSYAEALREAAGGAHRAVSGSEDGDDGGALGGVAAARRLLEAQRGHDPGLDSLADRLAEVSYLLADAAADLASYASGVEADPLRLQAAQERLALLRGLARKYDDPLAWARQAAVRLTELDGDDDRAEALAAERDGLAATMTAAAAELSAARHAAGERLAAAVSDELTGLAMPHAALTVAVTPADGFGPHGVDEVELLLTAHAGAPARPLARGASGGELSRVMLAVEVALAGADPVPTFVFDEVDAGVGGRAAVEVGRRLAALARHAQVLVVTHLPQVAAFADRHLVVSKADDGRVTRSDVRAVDGEERLRELSRMLAGLEDSELARGHAEELLAAAASAKAP